MRRVKTLNPVLISYSSQRQRIKKYRKIAELFVDICVWKKLNPDQSRVDHLRFKKQLLIELITFHSYGEKYNKTGEKTSAENPLRLTDRQFLRTYQKSGKN